MHPLAYGLLRIFRFGGPPKVPRGVRLRLALESLGPIFVKFGQVLSTRRDLIPLDIAIELALLQDRVPPFPSDQAAASIEAALGASPHTLFKHFETDPIASASIAQVHFAVLHDGRDVAMGRASGRERVCQYVSNAGVAGSLKNKEVASKIKQK